MNDTERSSELKFMKLIDESSPADSNLAIRCRDDAIFRHLVATMIDALESFYRYINKDASRNFTSKLNRWIKHPPDSYLGFFGELCVADQLRKWGIPHQYIQEVQMISNPDIELTIMERKVYLEVKTLQENPYQRFFKQIRKEVIKLEFGVNNIAVREVKIITGKEDALVVKAVQLIRDAAHNNHDSLIKHEGEEGKFSIAVRFATTPGQKPTGWISSWPGSRLRADGIPWVQSVLGEMLKNNIAQFRTNKPTFLALVNLDALLLDLETHASQVFERFGETDFVDVVGITIFDLVGGCTLIENHYRESEYTDLFKAIRDLSISNT